MQITCRSQQGKSESSDNNNNNNNRYLHSCLCSFIIKLIKKLEYWLPGITIVVSGARQPVDISTENKLQAGKAAQTHTLEV